MQPTDHSQSQPPHSQSPPPLKLPKISTPQQILSSQTETSVLTSSTLSETAMGTELEMASAIQFPYRKLKYGEESDDVYGRGRSLGRSRSWFRFKRVPIRKRFRLRIPGLRKLLRRKLRLVSAVRGSISRVLKRFKDGEGYLGDLFAGNYLFIQVNPNSLKKFQNYSLPRIEGKAGFAN